MTPLRILVLFLSIITPARAVDFSRPLFRSVKSGESVTLHCPFGDARNAESLFWYKQIFGEMPKKVGEGLAYKELKISPEFATSGFRLEARDKGVSLIIPQINKKHGGLYYCEKTYMDDLTLSAGTFLAVTGDEDVAVSQMSELEQVPAGASVTLQCSVLSESRAAELQVLWFRAAPPQSHPQIIYTHHNSSHQCESASSTHTCVYNFSKNILSLNDTGTYYCAVALCGKIIFGSGTPVQMENNEAEAKFVPKVIYLAVVVAACVVVIFVQAVVICKKTKGSEQSRVRSQQDSVLEKTLSQDTDELNYAALHFNKNRTKRVTRTREKPDDCVYSKVVSAM